MFYGIFIFAPLVLVIAVKIATVLMASRLAATLGSDPMAGRGLSVFELRPLQSVESESNVGVPASPTSGAQATFIVVVWLV